ncbi:MAG TPA: DUF1800 domain-containing protein [Gaiellaceae bacterium]|nr:DUF1800 domain-containing protein [Gaiellaceae bacterium]
MAGVAAYEGPFGPEQAERLLWRAGFGPRRGEATTLAKLGLADAVTSLVDPGPEKLVGPKPHDDHGHPLAPKDAWGHDHCWWLDKMVRTSRPLVERMTLVWHDWFATSNEGVGSQALMLAQNELFRRNALAPFNDLLLGVTVDPAMLLWLNGTDNVKGSPNENYGRELMELFTLGADRNAYTERDVREQARSLTGWQNRWSKGRGDFDFHLDPKQHDDGIKHVFGKSGDFDWRDACNLCLANPKHASFFVTKLWSYFVPTPPSSTTLASLEALYTDRNEVKPVVQAILMHPDLYVGQRMVKPPIVHVAGLLRRIGMGITTTDWAWIGQLSGQQLFYPPNVAGWDDTRWLDTATFRGRWIGAGRVLQNRTLNPNRPRAGTPATADELVQAALAFWNQPLLSNETVVHLTAFATRALGDAKADWEQKAYPVLIENALRQLIAVSPDLQTA